jgi:hypothetical protein
MAEDDSSAKSAAVVKGKCDWELNQERFEQLLTRLDTDRNRAAERLENSIRPALLIYFEKRACSDPYQLADVTIDRVAKMVCEDATIFLDETNRYFLGMAKNVYRQYLRDTKYLVSLEDAPVDRLSSPNPMEEQERVAEIFKRKIVLECCFHCISKLSEEERLLIIEYYSGKTGRGQDKSEQAKAVRGRLAQVLGIKQGVLKLRAFRIKAKVETCVTRCMEKPFEP